MKRTKKVLLASLFGCLFLCLGGTGANSYATTNLIVTDFAGLQNAFTAANANTTEDYVVTVNGTIQATAPLTLTGAKMTLAGNGTIQGYDSTASGSTKSSLIQADSSTLTIDGATISGHKGYTAIYLYSSTFTMKNGTIKNNSSTYEGGAIESYKSVIKMTGGEISNNTSSQGGGIYIDCSTHYIALQSPSVDLYPGTGNALEMTGGKITGNSADDGGGIMVYGSSSDPCQIKIDGGEILNNSARSFGGGIDITTGGIVNISGGNIADNTAVRNGKGIYVTKGTTLNLSSDAFINQNNDVYLDGTNTAVNVLSKLNKITREDPIALTPSDTTTVSTTTGVVGNKLVNYFAKASALEADMQDYFVLSDYVSTDAHIVQSDFTSEENYLILGKRMVSLFLKFSGIVGAEDETISLTKNDIITKSPAYQAVLAKYAKKGYTLEFYFDENHTNLLPADQAIVDGTTLYAQYVKNPNTLDNVAIYAIIGIATVAGTSVLLKSQKRSRR